jgi:hypothetical protein
VEIVTAEPIDPEPLVTIVNKYADDVPLTAAKVADAFDVSRWTIYRWKMDGYVFEFGRMTTLGHLKNWLRERNLTKKAESAKAIAKQNAVIANIKNKI